MSTFVLRPRDVMILEPAEILLPDLSKPARKLLEGFLRFPGILLMAGSKSNYLAKKLVEETIGGVAYVSAANTYFGLWTAALDDTSTGAAASEATYGSYARTLIGTANNQTDAWNAAAGATTATVTNKNAVTFPTSSSGTNTITYMGCLDNATTGAGNMLYWCSTNSQDITTGDTPKVNAAAFSVVED
jgi:hypothetical protein